jgi:hypothetical protein
VYKFRAVNRRSEREIRNGVLDTTGFFSAFILRWKKKPVLSNTGHFFVSIVMYLIHISHAMEPNLQMEKKPVVSNTCSVRMREKNLLYPIHAQYECGKKTCCIQYVLSMNAEKKTVISNTCSDPIRVISLFQ